MCPAYNFFTNPPALSPGDSFLAFNNETVLANETSQQIALVPIVGSGSKGVRVEVDFNANPGTYEFDIMECDSDQNGANEYQQVPTGGSLTTVTTGVNGASTHQSSDLIPVAGQMVAIFVKTAPTNANIKATVRVTRAV